mmetsp:Transcript_113981/g.322694  ORF Transcript_113981/g.322694 Transcript_113981/m.322694 type:complete len:216 (-) Transcript_113981:244-891(-)
MDAVHQQEGPQRAADHQVPVAEHQSCLLGGVPNPDGQRGHSEGPGEVRGRAERGGGGLERRCHPADPGHLRPEARRGGGPGSPRRRQLVGGGVPDGRGHGALPRPRARQPPLALQVLRRALRGRHGGPPRRRRRAAALPHGVAAERGRAGPGTRPEGLRDGPRRPQGHRGAGEGGVVAGLRGPGRAPGEGLLRLVRGDGPRLHRVRAPRGRCGAL